MPTAEVPVTNLYRDEMLDGATLPHQARGVHAVLSAREDVGRPRRARHQARPPVRQSRDGQVRASPTARTPSSIHCSTTPRTVCRRLGIPHRIVQMCTGDLSFVAAIKFDIEMWAPGCKEWLEVSSCSNFRDFQARRANIRFRTGKDKPQLVHTLNGSGLALPRVLDRGARDLSARRRLRHCSSGAAALHGRAGSHRTAETLSRGDRGSS